MKENFYYTVLSRKYRPYIFEEIIGQTFIINTLKKAIKKNKLAHALLFSGPRGVGKTSCARIVAREINKEKYMLPLEEEKNSNFNFDIFEIDAASNNSVDNIRELIEQVNLVPKKGKYKIYIIDEAHMLSQAAFNAFLKTLEEPPLHVKFILATTEKHKIPFTIISRCQIYEFHRISINDIKLKLKEVSYKENIQIEEDALFIIAKMSEGSLRDALSIFDKIICYNEGLLIKKELILEKLGILSDEYYFDIVNNIIINNISQILIIFDKILQYGFDISIFIHGLTSHFRNLFFSKEKEISSLLEFDKLTIEKYIDQSKKIPYNFIIKALELCNSIHIEYKITKNTRLYTEIFLIQLASLIKKKIIN